LRSAATAPKFLGLAVPLLGVLGALQGSAPNINSTALLSLTKALAIEGGGVALAASTQSILIAASVVSTGLMADRLGRRKVLMLALLVSAVGNAISGLAPVSAFYFLGQALTGIGLGAVYGSAFGYIHSVAKPGKLAAALGTFGAVGGLATMIITFSAAALVGVNWRLGFLLLAVLGVLGFLVVPLALPTISRLTGQGLDFLGQIILAIGVTGFLYGVSQLGTSITAFTTLGPLIGGVTLLVAFYGYESKAKGAFYPVALFRSPVFVAAILVGFVYNFGNSVAFLQTTNLWQFVTDVPTGELALWQVPFLAAGVIGALVTGQLMARGMTNRTAVLLGTVISVVGFALIAIVAREKAIWAFLPGLVIAGAGLLVVSIPFGNLFVKEAPPAQYGPVTSSRTTVGQFWYSIGFAVSMVVIDKLTTGGVIAKLTAAGVQPDMVGTTVSSINQYIKTDSEPTTDAARRALSATAESYSGAFTTMMLLSAALLLLAGLLAWFLLKRSAEHAEAPPGVSPA
jgi:MFS family permease